ncbi:tyrosine-type recombinase/integrase [Streptosporangium sp. NPDC051022]|uniref:tyrosine-type recombinase/integrase n=1 Tax=Streptosporangium sp. NPDC051022 TaxID=3155752 RepID=UPI003447DA96
MGTRVVTLQEIVGDLTWHLQRFSEPAPDGLVFVGEKGAQLRRSNFTKVWARAVAEAGIPKIHIHDLRHTGNTLAAMTGASLKELMARMGHSSTKAAMVYLHAAKDRDRAIADALGEIVKEGLRSKEDEPFAESKIN